MDAELEMETKVDLSTSRKIKDATAGYIGGAVQVLTGQPFDLVKVRLQTGQYKTPIEAVRETLKNEGILAFYKGTLTPLIGVGACVSVQFFSFYQLRRYLVQYNQKNGFTNTELSLKQFYLAGAGAGMANTFISSPVEQIRILLQTQSGEKKIYQGPLDAIQKIYKQHGLFKGIFRGFNITLAREAQAYGLWFVTYEYLINKELSKNIKRNEIPAWKLCLYGAIAGEALWIGSYPFDVIKSHIQSDKFGSQSKYKNAIDATGQTWNKFGFFGFWKGLVPTLLRAAPVSAATFMTVEFALRVLG